MSNPIRKRMVLVGDADCGKTCLLLTYQNGVFPTEYIPHLEQCVLDSDVDGTAVELGWYNPVGQDPEIDRRLLPLHYTGVDVIVICFAVDARTSLVSVRDKWYPEVMHFSPGAPIILAACKTDLRDASAGENIVSADEGQSAASAIGAARYIETSAKTLEGVRDLFACAARLALAASPRARGLRRRCVIL